MEGKKKNTRKRVYFIIGVILASILMNAVIYIIKSAKPLRIDFEEVNMSVDTYSASQGNYIAVCQENGFRQFPFVMGGRLSLLSIANGKIYTVRDNKQFLGGFVYPVLQGDNIYYFDGWDDSPQFLYVSNLRNKTKRQLVLEQVDTYAISGNKIFYTRGDNDASLYCKDIKSGLQKRLIRGSDSSDISYLSVKDSVLYCSDTEKGLLYTKQLESNVVKKYHISDTTDDWVGGVLPLSKDELLIATGKSGIIRYNTSNGAKRIVANLGDLNRAWDGESRYDFYYDKGSLYFYDKTYTAYKLVLETKQKIKLIDWSNVTTVQDYIKDTRNIGMHFFYCPDYIAVEIEYYDSEADFYDHRVVAFDYDGKLTLNKRI